MNSKVALITGATSGIGRAAALLFAGVGFDVVAVGRNAVDLRSLIDELGESRGSIETRICDVTNTAEVDRLIFETVESFGRMDVLVNCAGIIQAGTIESTSPDDWDKMLDV